jgi:type I restriction enzyme S subunit
LQTLDLGVPQLNQKKSIIYGKIPWINSGEVNNPFIIEAKKYITKLGLEKSSTKLFKRGTLLMAMYGATAGKVSILDIEACTNQAICTINVHLDLHRNYLKFVLEDLYEYLINLSSGSARDNLSQDRIKELNILTPKVEVVKDFDRIISPVYEKVLNSYRENQKLAELRDWLLPMLMNGQVKVN